MTTDLVTIQQATDPGTPARLDALLAELAIAEKWPMPEGYCYRCDVGGYGVRHYPALCDHSLRPMTLDRWLDLALSSAISEAGLRVDNDELSSEERRAQRAMLSPLVRALGERLIEYADATA